MVGRAAEVKFRKSELADLALEKKIEFLLDDLFTIVPSLKRK